jgi:hypothetical protein
MPQSLENGSSLPSLVLIAEDCHGSPVNVDGWEAELVLTLFMEDGPPVQSNSERAAIQGCQVTIPEAFFDATHLRKEEDLQVGHAFLCILMFTCLVANCCVTV